MAKNEFLPFATADGANVLSAEDYQTLRSRSNGFSAGVARSQELNTVWRQASVIAHVVAQFIADTNNSDVADDGDLDKLQAGLIQALSKNVNNTVPAASLKTAGITQLSSATDSDSETMAATPKAVKAIADTLSSGRLLNIQSFTRSGIYTPTPGTRKVKVILTGGGASGGINSSSENYGRSGGAGGTRIAFIDEPIDSTYVTIGAGGEAVTNVGAVGNPGGDSIFGNLMKANGGTTDFGLGGSSSGSGFGIDGGNGTSGGSQGNSTIGGVSYWGGGGTGVNTSESLSARAHGSGGAGVSSSSTSSGSGANGICIIEEYS